MPRKKKLKIPKSLTLRLNDRPMAVTKLEPYQDVPAWACGAFWTAIHAEKSLTVICEEWRVPEGLPTDTGWIGFELFGPSGFDNAGILASVADPLRDAGINILAIDDGDTDYLLVRSEQYEEAEKLILAAGNKIVTRMVDR